MARLVSEEIRPLPGRFETADMARGEPGLPAGFTWRGAEYRIAERLSTGKTTGLDRGEVYVRRHTCRLRMDDGSTWEVYVTRQRPRWYLKTVENRAYGA